MKRPLIGLIAEDLVKATYENEALKLGIDLKFCSKSLLSDELIKFAQDCNFLYVDPKIINKSTIKTAEKAGVCIYPSSKTLSEIDKIQTFQASDDVISILVARSSHNQSATYPLTLLTENLTITPLPGISDNLAHEIQLSIIKLSQEIELVGALELIVDATDYKKLVSLNWLMPRAHLWSQVGSVTNFYEQSLRAVLDLPLGSTELTTQYTVTGELKTDSESDDFRPYLHLMARNPRLKFDQSKKQVCLTGDYLPDLLTEVIHAQQYYSGQILE